MSSLNQSFIRASFVITTALASMHCSSSSTTPITGHDASTPGSGTGSGSGHTSKADAGSDASDCVGISGTTPIGGTCTTVDDCCVIANGGTTICEMAKGATTGTCLLGAGASCTADTDCTTTACSGGMCQPSTVGGPCANDQDCFNDMAGLGCLDATCQMLGQIDAGAAADGG